MTSVECAKCGLVSWAAEGTACKRCGAAAGVGYTQPKSAPIKRRAAAPVGDYTRPCLHCGGSVSLTRWDDWNGFLVECPHCEGLHGKRWSIRRVMMASFVFNAVSFLFTMRPAAAILSLSAFAAAAVAGYFFIDSLPDTLQIVAASAFILGPMLVNAVVLIIHERGLDQSSPNGQMLEA
ncbi:MAG TPA: hypothetical protein VFZ44_08790 [Pyrinomonadaceae bacterium]